MAKSRRKKKLTVMVSSTVYGIEELLNQVYALLTGFGYEVWMSHAGTIPLDPNLNTLEQCLVAVEKCDLFICLITPRYGSGVVEGEPGITHQELLKAVELDKLRWVMAHDHVVFARTLLRKLGGGDPESRRKLLSKLGFRTKDKLKELRKREALVLDDFRVIDMYEAAIRQDVPNVKERTGNWVQKYSTPDDVRRFINAQFSRYADVEQFYRARSAEDQRDPSAGEGSR